MRLMELRIFDQDYRKNGTNNKENRKMAWNQH